MACESEFIRHKKPCGGSVKTALPFIAEGHLAEAWPLMVSLPSLAEIKIQSGVDRLPRVRKGIFRPSSGLPSLRLP